MHMRVTLFDVCINYLALDIDALSCKILHFLLVALFGLFLHGETPFTCICTIESVLKDRRIDYENVG